MADVINRYCVAWLGGDRFSVRGRGGEYISSHELAGEIASLPELQRQRDELLAALVREHNCNHPVDAGPACGCETCRLIASMTAPKETS